MSMRQMFVEDFETGLVPYLNFKVSTWYKDHFGLYDNDGVSINDQSLNGYSSLHLYRYEAGQECELSNKLLEDHPHLLDMVQNEDTFYIAAGDLKTKDYYQTAAWYVINDFCDYSPALNQYNCSKRGHKLKVGNVIKVGRYIWKIVEVSNIVEF